MQSRKLYGALQACDGLVKSSGGKFLVTTEFSVADVRPLAQSPVLNEQVTHSQIAVGNMLRMMTMVETLFR